MTRKFISLRGVRVHNLKSVDLDLPLSQMTVICGRSGSGKSSLAFDTLYAEGQRRYLETLSASTRQFLEQMDRPEADRIENVPPSIAVAQGSQARPSRATVGSTTEIEDYLRLLFAKLAIVHCPHCQGEVRLDDAPGIADQLCREAAGQAVLIGFPWRLAGEQDPQEQLATLMQRGFARLLIGNKIHRLEEVISQGTLGTLGPFLAPCYVIVDRARIGETSLSRLRDSLETTFKASAGPIVVLVERGEDPAKPAEEAVRGEETITVEGKSWHARFYWDQYGCPRCAVPIPLPEPQLYNPQHRLGACPACNGSGEQTMIDWAAVVPDKSKSLRQGAIAPWATGLHHARHEAMLAFANEAGIPVDQAFETLPAETTTQLLHGDPQRGFSGVRGFLQELHPQGLKGKKLEFWSRFHRSMPCEACRGTRLRSEALAARLAGEYLPQVCARSVEQVRSMITSLKVPAGREPIILPIVRVIQHRLEFLIDVGLSYLAVNRPMHTLSTGEARRVAMTVALGSSLVDVLYVLDEPTAGLHPQDRQRLRGSVESLRRRGNTVVVVEHDQTFLDLADLVVEVGPEAGGGGGEITFVGTPRELCDTSGCLTGDFLSGRRIVPVSENRRKCEHGWLKLRGATGRNLKGLDVDFPLGVFCVVTGVSGSGKSTLVMESLYPALCQILRKLVEPTIESQPCQVLGVGGIDDCIVVDPTRISLSNRSNPVTYLKALDEIRTIFASTVEAKTRNYPAGHFSFNVDGGRCEACQGDGFLPVNLQFLPDVNVRCEQCHGTRFRPEILQVRYRDRSIADVLQMTVREAFLFFRGTPKLQAKLKRLIDVGLDYVTLGQPANSLSGGESQRLKLAGHLASTSKARTLFIMDEPTHGLHPADLVYLLDCFDSLIAVGHSLIVIEHNLHLIQAADYLIDLGPGAGAAGGQVIATGSPEEVVAVESSLTGKFLAPFLQRTVS